MAPSSTPALLPPVQSLNAPRRCSRTKPQKRGTVLKPLVLPQIRFSVYRRSRCTRRDSTTAAVDVARRTPNTDQFNGIVCDLSKNRNSDARRTLRNAFPPPPPAASAAGGLTDNKPNFFLAPCQVVGKHVPGRARSWSVVLGGLIFIYWGLRANFHPRGNGRQRAKGVVEILGPASSCCKKPESLKCWYASARRSWPSNSMQGIQRVGAGHQRFRPKWHCIIGQIEGPAPRRSRPASTACWPMPAWTSNRNEEWEAEPEAFARAMNPEKL